MREVWQGKSSWCVKGDGRTKVKTNPRTDNCLKTLLCLNTGREIRASNLKGMWGPVRFLLMLFSVS